MGSWWRAASFCPTCLTSAAAATIPTPATVLHSIPRFAVYPPFATGCLRRCFRPWHATQAHRFGLVLIALLLVLFCCDFCLLDTSAPCFLGRANGGLSCRGVCILSLPLV
eukprot:6472978-Amphidinium_carterae.1